MKARAFPHPGLREYALLDSGGAEKWERFGPITLRRPDPQALWRKRRPESDWATADLSFCRESDRGGRWDPRPGFKPPAEWPLDLTGAKVLLRPTPFKHVGLFPEQAANWVWVEARRGEWEALGEQEPRLLNLFGYTGAATVLAARAGWKVTHVDASRASLDWAAVNARLSGLAGDAVRWMLEDAAEFAAREVRRKRRYHGILVDPPHYGRGPKGQKWQLEQGLAALMEHCRALLVDEGPAFVVLSTYAVGASPLAYENLLGEFGKGEIESGELALPEEDGGRLLPCGFCARWWRG